MKTKFTFLLTSVITLLMTSVDIQAQTRYYVSGDGNNADGLSWATAFQTLQTAIDATVEGDTIFVKKGVYTSSVTYSLTNKNIKFFGSFEGNETELSQRSIGSNPTDSSTLDAQNSTQMFSLTQRTDATVIDGFKIINGDASGGDGGGIRLVNSRPVLRNLIISGNSATRGGGIYCETISRPTLENVIISNNTATRGGGMYFEASSSGTLTNVTIRDNTANNNGGGMCLYESSPTLNDVTISGNTATQYGGGIYNYDSSPTLNDVTISGNTATQTGGGIFNENTSSPILNDVTISGNMASSGGGMYNMNSTSELTIVTIRGNTASISGGGIFNTNSSPILNNVTISDNTSNSINNGEGGGGMFNINNSLPKLTNVKINGNKAAYGGGGMYNDNSSPELTNVLISGNTADAGGGIYNFSSSPELTNVTISGNTANTGGGMRNNNSSPELYNSIVLGNNNDINTVGSSNPEYNYCLVGGTGYGFIKSATWITNTYTATDIFVDYQQSSAGTPTTLGDYRLKPTGFAIDRGLNSYNNTVTLDLAGNTRIMNFIIDLGAYEYQGAPTKTITIGPASGTLRELTVGSVDYSITTTGFNDGSKTITVNNLPSGVTYIPNVTISGGIFTLTLNGDNTTSAGVTTNLSLEIDGDTSPDFTLTINPYTLKKYHVSTTGSDTDDGLAWGTAFATLTKAISVALAGGDTIFVKKGTYTLTAPYNLNNNDIKIFGSFNGSESSPDDRIFGVNEVDSTVLDGDNSYQVFNLYGRTAVTEIDGFKITGGAASSNGGGMSINNSSPVLRNLIISGNTAIQGGGIYNNNSSPILTEVKISGNTASYNSGGMQNDNSSPILTNVTITGNSATGGDGGGMSNYDSSKPILTNVTITGNSATQYGGGMYNNNSSPTLTDVNISDNKANEGAGMCSTTSSSAELTNVTITNNEATQYGGGMFNNHSTPTLTNVTISGNTATNGGGMWNRESSLTLTNVLISGNNATNQGGGIYNYEVTSTTSLTNVSISGNSAAIEGGGVYNYTSSPSLYNSIVLGNGSNDIGGWGASNPEYAYSLVGGTGFGYHDGIAWDNNTYQANNIFVTPQAPTNAPTTLGNYRLETLPNRAIDAGLNSYNDVIPTDLDGNIRITGASIDLGAYEANSTTFQSVTVDVQNGTMIAGVAGTVTFDVTTVGIADGPHAATVNNLSAVTGVSVQGGTITINNNSGTLTLEGDNTTIAGVANDLELTIGSGTSPAFTLTIDVRPIMKYHVSLSGDDVLHDGLSWGAAFLNLSKAISEAVEGDTIFVGKGVYNQSASYVLDNYDLKIFGSFNGNESSPDERTFGATEADSTVLDAQNTSSFRVFRISDRTDATVIDGFKITNGSSNPGGGMYLNNSSPVLRNLIISGNSIGGTGQGGGVENNNSSPTLINVLISGNTATTGGGMYNANSLPTLINVVISGNTASGNGGGMLNTTNSIPTLTNVTISGNSAILGGGMHNYGSSPELTNVLISGNMGSSGGGGMYNISTSTPTLTNVTISGNRSTSGGGMFNSNSSPELYNSIVLGNGDNEIYNAAGSNPVYDYSLIGGTGTGYGYHDGSSWDDTDYFANVIFVTPQAPLNAPTTLGDYRLHTSPASFAIDAGLDSYNNTIPADLDGNIRITGASIDLGAYEANSTILQPEITVSTSPSGLFSGLKVGQTVTGSIIFTLVNATYAGTITASDFINITGLPPGLMPTATRTDNTHVTVAIAGAPTAYNASSTTLSFAAIPAANITGAISAVTVTGAVTASAVAQGDGAAVDNAPIVSGSPTTTSITVGAVNITTNPGAQNVEYGYSTSSSIPPTSWQSGTTFTGLTAGVTYYIFARSEANTNYAAGAPQVSAIPTAPASIAPSITTATLPGGTEGAAYSATLAATGSSPITWSVSNGSLPSGLTFSPAGVILGTPTTAGSSSFTVTATNVAGSDAKAFSITVATVTPPTPPTPTVTPPNMPGNTSLPSGSAGSAYNESLFATGSLPMTWTLVSGNLPPGLTLLPDGTISGTPTQEGTYTITVTVSNSAGSATSVITIVIDPPVGTEFIGSNELKIYPSPFVNEIRITGAYSESSPTTLHIFSSLGVVIHTRQITSVDEILHLGSLPAGLYFFRLENDGKSVTLKLVKR